MGEISQNSLTNEDTDDHVQLELERLDLTHHVITLLLGGELFLAPLDQPRRVLDIGTGTGLWAIEMADRFPRALVVGTDLSPIQPTWYGKGKNVRSKQTCGVG